MSQSFYMPIYTISVVVEFCTSGTEITVLLEKFAVAHLVKKVSASYGKFITMFKLPGTKTYPTSDASSSHLVCLISTFSAIHVDFS
jgi:hypothetical protein